MMMEQYGSKWKQGESMMEFSRIFNIINISMNATVVA